MPHPDRPGNFKATPLQWSVTQQGKNKLLTFMVKYLLTHWWNDETNEWQSCSHLNMESVGYHYLTTAPKAAEGDKPAKDAGWNERGIQSVREAFGWTGDDIETLHNTNWSMTQVQVQIDEEIYEGKKRLKLNWLNHVDRAVGFQRAAPEFVAGLAAQFNAGLRAISANTAPAGMVVAPKPDPAAEKPRKNRIAAGQPTLPGTSAPSTPATTPVAPVAPAASSAPVSTPPVTQTAPPPPAPVPVIPIAPPAPLEPSPTAMECTTREKAWNLAFAEAKSDIAKAGPAFYKAIAAVAKATNTSEAAFSVSQWQSVGAELEIPF